MVTIKLEATNQKKKLRCILWGAALFVLCFSFASKANASSSTGTIDITNAYAWSENAGWINFGTSQGNITVSSSSLTGYAWSENLGWISLNCLNTGSCGTVNYGIANDGSGNLSGYAWSENAGWINFGSFTNSVKISTSTGDFSGYAWGENVGWVSFNCSNTSSCGTNSYKVNTTWVGTGSSSTTGLSSGYLDSQTFDTGVVGGAQLNSVLWHGILPAGTAVGFQFAVSSSSAGPWTFTGPDGWPNSSSSYWNGSNTSSSIPLNYSLYNNFRYFRYRVTLFSNTARTVSPRVDDIVINWSQ